jgi:hypothetical protein
MVEKMLGTGSPIVKWREMYPGKVGSEEDIVISLVREGLESVEVVGETTIWLVKKAGVDAEGWPVSVGL